MKQRNRIGTLHYIYVIDINEEMYCRLIYIKSVFIQYAFIYYNNNNKHGNKKGFGLGAIKELQHICGGF